MVIKKEILSALIFFKSVGAAMECSISILGTRNRIPKTGDSLSAREFGIVKTPTIEIARTKRSRYLKFISYAVNYFPT